MISDFKLRAIVIVCLLVLTASMGYAWYTIGVYDLPRSFGFCLIGVMASLYFIGLTFDRYRRALYVEAKRLYDNERVRADDLAARIHVRAEDLAARIHVRDITIDRLRKDLEYYHKLSSTNNEKTREIDRRINLIIDNLNTAIGKVSSDHESNQV